MRPLIHCRPTSQDQDWHGLVVYKTPAEKAKKEFEKGLRDVEAGKRHVDKGDEHLGRAQAQDHEAEIAREAVINKAGDLSEMQRTIDPQLAEARWQAFRTKIKGVVEIKEQEAFNRLIIELERLRDFLAEDKNRLDFEGKREEASRLLSAFRKELANVNRKFSENRPLQEKHPGLQVPDLLSGSDIGSVEEWRKALDDAGELADILRENNAENAVARTIADNVEKMNVGRFESELEQKCREWSAAQGKKKESAEEDLKLWYYERIGNVVGKMAYDPPHSPEDLQSLTGKLQRWRQGNIGPTWLNSQMRERYFDVAYGKYVIPSPGAYTVERDDKGKFTLRGEGPSIAPPYKSVPKEQVEEFLTQNDTLFALRIGADRSVEQRQHFNYTGPEGIELIKQVKNMRIDASTPEPNSPQWENFKRNPLSALTMASPVQLILTVLMFVFAPEGKRYGIAKALFGLGVVQAIGGTEGLKSGIRDTLGLVGIDSNRAISQLKEKGMYWLYEQEVRSKMGPRDVDPRYVSDWDTQDYLVFGFMKSENITFEQIREHGSTGLPGLEHLKRANPADTWRKKLDNLWISVRQGAVDVGLAGLSKEDFERFLGRSSVRTLVDGNSDSPKNFASTFEETYRKPSKKTKNEAPDQVGKKNIDTLNALSAPSGSAWKGEAQEDSGKAKRPLEITLPDAKKRQFVVTSETDGTIMARTEGFELGYENAAAFAKLPEHARTSTGGIPASAEEMKTKVVLPVGTSWVSSVVTYASDDTFRSVVRDQTGKMFAITRSAQDERKAYTLIALDAEGKATGTPTTFADIDTLNTADGLAKSLSSTLASAVQATHSAEYFSAVLGRREKAEYLDTDSGWFNARFCHSDGHTYHAFAKQGESGEGFWVERVVDQDGSTQRDSAAYALFFPTRNVFTTLFDRTVEIMARPNGKTSLSKLLNDGLAKLPVGSWKFTKLETFPTDSDIDGGTGHFSVEIEITAAAPDDKLKLYIAAGADKFQVQNSAGTVLENVPKSTTSAKSYEFDDGVELDTILKLTANTPPPAAPESPTEGDPANPAHSKIREVSTLLKNGNLDNPDKLPLEVVSDKPWFSGNEYFMEIKIGGQPFNITIPAGKRSPINVFVPRDEGKNVRLGKGLEASFPDYETLRQQLIKNVVLQLRVDKAQSVRDAWLRLSNGLKGWVYLSPTGEDNILYAREEVSGASPSIANKAKGYWQWSDLAPKEAQDLMRKCPSQIYDVK